MTAAVAVAGWAAAACSGAGAALARRSLSARIERIARACHELRGPITAARLGLELGVRRGALSPARLRALDLELGRAALAIDDLAGAGSSAGRWEEVDLCWLLSDSVEAWRGSAEARGVALSCSWAGQPALVFADRLRVAQATGNLIANAIEHGGGTVEVRAQAGLPAPAGGEGMEVGGEGQARRDRGPHGPAATIRIEFIDDGPGLPAPVSELARRGRHRRGAHGHGLAIAHEVALTHGGRLAAAPCERGARIVLELPIVAARGVAANCGD
ncbi:MAG TPA: HAMP domain-containing sensor histidine kinase [Solirubrobacteraceae bacterium]|nr:HAMP domain-containing sensor histidine kinase [Solirubrobacteraceae bacterium]